MRIEVPRSRPPSVRLTPLIDVVFILLVFFMLASSFLDWRAFELALPAADATPDPEVSPVVIAVDAEGGLRVAGETVDPAALVGRVQALRREGGDGAQRPVVIRAAADTPVRLTVRALDRLRAGGVRAVSLAEDAR